MNFSVLKNNGSYVHYGGHSLQRDLQGLPIALISDKYNTPIPNVGNGVYEHMLVLRNGDLYSFIGEKDPLKFIASHVISVHGGMDGALVIFEQPGVPQPRLDAIGADEHSVTLRIDGPRAYPGRLESSPFVDGPWRTSRILTLTGSVQELTVPLDKAARFFRFVRHNPVHMEPRL
jgi:hypothetical protein